MGRTVNVVAHRRSLGLVGLVVANLVPLWLLLNGALDLAALILCYAIEAFILGALVRWPGGDLWEMIKMIFGAYLMTILAGAYAASQIAWSRATLVGIAACVLFLLAGLFWSGREHGLRSEQTTGGFTGWLRRFSVLLVGFFGLAAVEDYELLRAHGWEPATLDGGLLEMIGLGFARFAIEFDVAPLTIAGVVLIGLQTANDVLSELSVILRERHGQLITEYDGKHGTDLRHGLV
jgi:hypothetical protein